MTDESLVWFHFWDIFRGCLLAWTVELPETLLIKIILKRIMYLRWLWVSCLCPLVFFLTITFDVNWLNRVLALTYSLLDIFYTEKLTTWQTNPSCDFTFGIFSEDVFCREQLNCLRLFLFKDKQTFIVIGVFKLIQIK
jgi:hypothetical protein